MIEHLFLKNTWIHGRVDFLSRTPVLSGLTRHMWEDDGEKLRYSAEVLLTWPTSNVCSDVGLHKHCVLSGNNAHVRRTMAHCTVNHAASGQLIARDATLLEAAASRGIVC
jgi:hypothetical protein